MDGQAVEVLDDAAANLDEALVAHMLLGDEVLTDFQPFGVETVCRAGLSLIRTHPVQDPHEDIAKDQSVETFYSQTRGNLEARISLQMIQVQGYYRNLLLSSLGQSPADEGDVVGGTAAAAGLGDDNGQLICVVFTGKDSSHNLPYHHQRGVAGVVVDIF